MSYDIYVHRFEGGESAPLDKVIAAEVLDSYVVVRVPDNKFLQLDMGRNERADVYFSTDTHITFTRFGGERIMDIVAELLERLGASLVLLGGTVVLRQEAHREHLPQLMRDDDWSVVVARTGQEIMRAIEAS
ncbi:hypothetical protein ABZ883_22625 [Streptomyces sp. NPDC046977]|uniref:hypothetical protein n=1 Tax=Streptomyces sp. NPDC046977 TaxID=3154703 RepID=UPI0033CE0B3E